MFWGHSISQRRHSICPPDPGEYTFVGSTTIGVGFFFSSRSRHTSCYRDWSSDVCSSDLGVVRVVLDVNGVKEYTASLTSNPPQLLIDLYGNSPAAPVRTAKGKPASQAGTEESSEIASAANAEARTVQNTAAKGPAKDAAPSSEQPSAISKGAINATIGGGAIKRGAINGGATNGSGAGSNSAAVARNSLPSVKSAKSKSGKANAASAKPDLIRPA